MSRKSNTYVGTQWHKPKYSHPYVKMDVGPNFNEGLSKYGLKLHHNFCLQSGFLGGPSARFFFAFNSASLQKRKKRVILSAKARPRLMSMPLKI
jgi:hypothetical protein